VPVINQRSVVHSPIFQPPATRIHKKPESKGSGFFVPAINPKYRLRPSRCSIQIRNKPANFHLFLNNQN